MKTICLLFTFIVLNSFAADEYKLPFTWEAKKVDQKVEVQKAKVHSDESRTLASEVEEEAEEVRFWKFEQNNQEVK